MPRTSNNFFKIEMLILRLLEVQDCYGYQIVQLLSELTDGVISLKEGTMYPILYRMIDRDLISDKKVLVGRRQSRVYYHLEPAGKEELDRLYKAFNETHQSVENIMNWTGEN